MSLLALFILISPYNLIVFGLYSLLSALRRFGWRQRAIGYLSEKGEPLSFAIIRVFAADLNVEITNKVADKIGRYYCLVNNGQYYVKIERKNNDESYTTIYTSPIIEVNKGIINSNFVI